MEKVIVFGLGNEFRKYKDRIEANFCVVGYADNNYVPDDLYILQKTIVPTEIVEISFDRVLITTSLYKKSIRDQLLNQGVDGERIIAPPFLEGYISYQSYISEGLVKRRMSSDRIYVVGDSHSIFFAGGKHQTNNPLFSFPEIYTPMSIKENFTVYHIGPVLAYNLNEYNHKMQGREKIDVLMATGLLPKGSRVIFCFGEIDIRVHILKESEKKGVKYQEIVKEVIDRYMTFLIKMSQCYEVFVWSPVASIKDGSEVDSNYPYWGTEKDRNIVTEYFGEKLSEAAAMYNIGFLSIFDKLVNDEYMTRKEYYIDTVHLSYKAWKYAEICLNQADI